jgi:hypothetical protein
MPVSKYLFDLSSNYQNNYDIEVSRAYRNTLNTDLLAIAIVHKILYEFDSIAICFLIQE